MTSHAPHLIAYTMVGVADDLSRVTDSEVIQCSAAGFRDFARIAASDPTMWRDIFRSNSDAVLSILNQYQHELSTLQALIEDGDFDQLSAVFARSKKARDHFSEVLARRETNET